MFVSTTLLCVLIHVFTDIYCKHRPANARREQATNATSGPVSPPVSARLEYVSVYEDGGVGMPVYITVIKIQKRFSI